MNGERLDGPAGASSKLHGREGRSFHLGSVRVPARWYDQIQVGRAYEHICRVEGGTITCSVCVEGDWFDLAPFAPDPRKCRLEETCRTVTRVAGVRESGRGKHAEVSIALDIFTGKERGRAGLEG